jgi:hypothetical protein
VSEASSSLEQRSGEVEKASGHLQSGPDAQGLSKGPSVYRWCTSLGQGSCRKRGAQQEGGKEKGEHRQHHLAHLPSTSGLKHIPTG